MPKATSIQLLLRLPIKKDSLSELRDVYQATPNSKAKYPMTKQNNTTGDINYGFGFCTVPCNGSNRNWLFVQ